MCSQSVLSFSQTGKEDYDSSIKVEEEAAYAIGSVFQGLQADLEGFVASLSIRVIIDPLNRSGSTRMFIVSITCLPFFKGKFIPVGPLNRANNWYWWTYGRAVYSYSRT
jgi:hypothetical protein